MENEKYRYVCKCDKGQCFGGSVDDLDTGAPKFCCTTGKQEDANWKKNGVIRVAVLTIYDGQQITCLFDYGFGEIAENIRRNINAQFDKLPEDERIKIIQSRVSVGGGLYTTHIKNMQRSEYEAIPATCESHELCSAPLEKDDKAS